MSQVTTLTVLGGAKDPLIKIKKTMFFPLLLSATSHSILVLPVCNTNHSTFLGDIFFLDCKVRTSYNHVTLLPPLSLSPSLSQSGFLVIIAGGLPPG